MFRILFLLFIVVPIIEIALLIQVSDIIGGVATIALVITTAVLGAKLVKQQGLTAFKSVQGQMTQGQMPAKELFAGLCVIIAGVLLMTPGIVTDVMGFLLLTPAVRKLLAAGLIEHVTAKMQSSMSGSNQAFKTHTDSPFNAEQSSPLEKDSVTHTTIEGEYQRKD